MESNDNPFELNAVPYDRWFDSGKGKIVFARELSCLENIIGKKIGRWLEVGVGTGRFAKALDIREGIDPSPSVLRMAKARGIQTYCGYGEKLPFPDNAFEGVLIAFAICFMKRPAVAISEAFRVLNNTGRLIVGFIPANSILGKLYEHKGRAGHPFYSTAVFWTEDKLIRMITEKGFIFENMKTCFLSNVENVSLSPKTGIGEIPDFVAVAFSKLKFP